MNSPYEGLPESRYWRSGVSQKHPFDIDALYRKKFDIAAGDRIATVGKGDLDGESGLYFEIRVQGKPVDPMKWIAR